MSGFKLAKSKVLVLVVLVFVMLGMGACAGAVWVTYKVGAYAGSLISGAVAPGGVASQAVEGASGSLEGMLSLLTNPEKVQQGLQNRVEPEVMALLDHAVRHQLSQADLGPLRHGLGCIESLGGPAAEDVLAKAANRAASPEVAKRIEELSSQILGSSARPVTPLIGIYDCVWLALAG